MAENVKPAKTPFTPLSNKPLNPQFTPMRPVHNPFGTQQLYKGIGQVAWNPTTTASGQQLATEVVNTPPALPTSLVSQGSSGSSQDAPIQASATGILPPVLNELGEAVTPIVDALGNVVDYAKGVVNSVDDYLVQVGLPPKFATNTIVDSVVPNPVPGLGIASTLVNPNVVSADAEGNLLGQDFNTGGGGLIGVVGQAAYNNMNEIAQAQQEGKEGYQVFSGDNSLTSGGEPLAVSPGIGGGLVVSGNTNLAIQQNPALDKNKDGQLTASEIIAEAEHQNNLKNAAAEAEAARIARNQAEEATARQRAEIAAIEEARRQAERNQNTRESVAGQGVTIGHGSGNWSSGSTNYRNEGGNVMAMNPMETPMAPQMPMRETFADKVAKARDLIKSRRTVVPTTTVAENVMVDGQGDGPVQFGEGAGYLTQGEVGPDMGPDDVDAMVPEGSFVMNAEGTSMNGPEIDAMEAEAGPPMYNQGTMPMVRAKLTKGERVIAPHVVSMYRDRLEAMNQGGLAMRNNQVNYNVLGGVQEGLDSIDPDIGMALGQDIVSAAYGERGTGLNNLIANREEASKEDNDLSNKAKSLQAANEEVIVLAEEARELVAMDSTREAGDMFNGFKPTGDEEAEAEIAALDKQFTDVLKGLVQTGAGAFDSTRRVREEAMGRIVSRLNPEGYRNFIRLRTVANNMILPVVASGALGVNPTDKDVELAKQSQFDLTTPSNTWDSQLVDLINRKGGVAQIAEETGNQQTVQDVEEGRVSVNTSVLNDETRRQQSQLNLIATPTEVVEEEQVVEPTEPTEGTEENPMAISNVPMKADALVATLREMPRDTWVTVVIDGFFKNKTVTDTVGNILDYLEEKHGDN